MNAIGPGDWVECVSNQVAGCAPQTKLVVGRVYLVTKVGVTPPRDPYPNVPWVRLREVKEDPRRWGFRAEWFRPIYRPREELIEQLLQPVSETVRDLVSAD
jgi:hypothetical protein